MAWSYADFESQATDALRLERVRLHIDEVAAKISADHESAGMKRSVTPLVEYRTLLETRRAELQRRVDATTRVGFTRWRPV